MIARAKAHEEVPLDGKIVLIANTCRRIIHQHSMLAAIAGAVPAIGVDVATEALIAATMANRILARVGLTHEQITAMDLTLKTAVMQSIRQQSANIVGRIVTSKALIPLIAHSGKSFVSRRLARLAPTIGTAVSASLGYAAMWAVGYAVLDECLRVRVEVATAKVLGSRSTLQ